MELLLEGFHRTISLFLIDDDSRSSLRRALSNQADTDLRRLKGTEDTSIDSRATEHIAPLKVDQRLPRERSQCAHHLIPWMGGNQRTVRLFAVAEGIEHAKRYATLLQWFNGLDVQDLRTKLRQLRRIGIGEFVYFACFGDDGGIGGIDAIDVCVVLHQRGFEEVR